MPWLALSHFCCLICLIVAHLGQSTKRWPSSLPRSLSALQTWIWQRKTPLKESRGTLDQFVQVSRPGDKVQASLHDAKAKTPCLHDSTRRLAQSHGIDVGATGNSVGMPGVALGYCLGMLRSKYGHCRVLSGAVGLSGLSGGRSLKG